MAMGTPISESLNFALRILETEVQVVPASVVPFNYAISKLREVILSLPASGIASAVVQPIPISSNSPLPQLHGVAKTRLPAQPPSNIPQIAPPLPVFNGNSPQVHPATNSFGHNNNNNFNNVIASAPAPVLAKQPYVAPQPTAPTPAVKKEGSEVSVRYNSRLVLRLIHVSLKKQDAIKNQMEFYFSDANLAKDRFLKTLIDASPDGCKYCAKYEYDIIL